MSQPGNFSLNFDREHSVAFAENTGSGPYHQDPMPDAMNSFSLTASGSYHPDDTAGKSAYKGFAIVLRPRTRIAIRCVAKEASEAAVSTWR